MQNTQIPQPSLDPTQTAPFADLDPETLRGLALEAETALLRLPRDCAEGAEVALTLAALESALDAQDADFLAA